MKKKKLFSLALSVALVLSTVVMPVNVVFGAGTAYTESESNDYAGSADSISISSGSSVSGYIDENDTDWFKFEVKKSSVVNVKAYLYGEDGPSLYCEVYGDEDFEDEKFYEYVNYNENLGYFYKNTDWYLEAGTYYLKLTKSAYNKEKYEIHFDSTECGNVTEPNDYIGQAYPLTTGKNYTGILATGGDDDYFEFYAEKEQNYYFTVKNNLSGSARLFLGAYDSEGNPRNISDGLYSITIENGKTETVCMRLPQGATYFSIEGAYIWSNDGYGIYTINIDGEPTCDVETGTNAAGKPKLTWNPVNGASKYVVYRSGYRDGTYTKMFTTTNTSYTNTSAKAGYAYYYKVSALNKSGKVIAKSDILKVKCITASSAKMAVNTSNSPAGKPKLTWNSVSGASKYVIYRSGYKDGTYTKMYTTTGKSYTNTSAKAGYAYYYKVSALNKSGKVIAKSDILKVKCVTVAPAKMAVNTSNSPAGKPKLTWNSVSGASKYVVYRSGYKDGTYTKMYTTTGKSYTNTSAKAGYAYYYKVSALNKSGKVIAKSDILKVKCVTVVPVEPIEPVEPDAPTKLDAPKLVNIGNNENTGKIILKWENVPNANRYIIYRATSANGVYDEISTFDAPLNAEKTYTYTDTAANAAKMYYYKVRAVNTESSESASELSDYMYRTCDLEKPKLVNIGNDASSGKIVLQWKDVPDANQYVIYRATSEDGPYSKVRTFDVPFNTGKTYTFTNTDATAGKTYYYKVQAINTNHSGANSALSNYMYRTCDLARPTVTVTTNSKGQPVLSWKAISGADKYQIYRATSSDGPWTKTGTITGTSVINTLNLTKGKTYYYRVNAVDANNSYATSAYSLVVSKKYAGEPEAGSVSYTWPLKNHRTITGYWGLEDGHMYDNHYGIDISAPLGTTIYAAAPGTVVAATYKDGYGNYVRIRHANGQETLYAHASKLAVKTGQKVSRGTVVGYVGNTGGPYGYHLHFGIYKNSTAFAKEFSSHPAASTITYNPLTLLK